MLAVCDAEGLIGLDMFAFDGVGSPNGTVRQSNRTDKEGAKMATSEGVIQGYTSVATVDAQHQIIVDAQAHDTGSEAELLRPVIAAMEGRSHTEQMRQRMDFDEGRAQYAQRIAVVEPVFGNVRYNKGLDCFTLRGRE